jgi:hypothetical protein
MEMFEFRAPSVKNRASKDHYKICNIISDYDREFFPKRDGEVASFFPTADSTYLLPFLSLA